MKQPCQHRFSGVLGSALRQSFCMWLFSLILCAAKAGELGVVKYTSAGSNHSLSLTGLDVEPIVLLSMQKPFTFPETTTFLSGKIVFQVSTTQKTQEFAFEQNERGQLRFNGSQWDLQRGRVFLIDYPQLEFAPAVYQVPLALGPMDTPEGLLEGAGKVVTWMAGTNAKQRWEQTRVMPDQANAFLSPGTVHASKPPDDIVWGESNEGGLSLGLSGIKPGGSAPVGQPLPLKQYIRNAGKETVKFSFYGSFGEGVEAELTDAEGNKIEHKKTYPWPMLLYHVSLAPGEWMELDKTPKLSTTMANKDGSAPDRELGLVARPGAYTLQVTQILGDYIGPPRNTSLGDVRIAPWVGEWVGRVSSAPFPLTLADPEVGTAKPGSEMTFINSYRIDFKPGELKLNLPITNRMRRDNDPPYPVDGGTWKTKAPDGNYLAAWDVGGWRLWLLDGDEVQKLLVGERWAVRGSWPIAEQGTFGDMPDAVRAALKLPPAKQVAAKLSVRGFNLDDVPVTKTRPEMTNVFEIPLASEPGQPVVLVPNAGKGYYVQIGVTYYGPIRGNPDRDLGLYKFLKQHIETHPNPETYAFLEKMLRQGNGGLTDLGYRLVGGLKDPASPFDYDALFSAAVGASLDEHGQRMIGGSAGIGYEKFWNLVHALHEAWERCRVQLPEDRYERGQSLTDASNIQWSKGATGVSLGVSGMASGAELPVGGKIPLEVFLRNDTAATVYFSWPKNFRSGLKISFTDKTGQKQQGRYRFSQGFDMFHSTELPPGMGVKVASFELQNFAKQEDIDSANSGEYLALAVPPGNYTTELEYRLGNEVSPDASLILKQGDKLEWTGRLSFVPVEIKVTPSTSQ